MAHARHVLSLLAFFVGGLFGPILFPYKMFLEDYTTEIIHEQMASLGQSYTYVGPNALLGFALFAIVYVAGERFFKMSNIYAKLVFYFVLGCYYDLLINGNAAGKIHIFLDTNYVNYWPETLKNVFSVLIPIVSFLVVPIAAGVLFSLGAKGIGRAFGSRETSVSA